MGRASRRKKERSKEESPLLSPENQLAAVTESVALMYGINADCAGAAALMVEIGDALGIKLQQRPVSVIAHEKSSGTTLTMGPKASSRFTPEQMAGMENYRPNGKDTGHIVVISDEHRALLDPNMRQLENFGVNAPAVMMRVKSAQPESGEWVFQWEDNLEILYILDDENEALIPRFEAMRSQCRATARAMATDISAGLAAPSIAQRAIAQLKKQGTAQKNNS